VERANEKYLLTKNYQVCMATTVVGSLVLICLCSIAQSSRFFDCCLVVMFSVCFVYYFHRGVEVYTSVVEKFPEMEKKSQQPLA